MYISNIEIENFRQLDKVVLSFEKDMTVLAGPNNSGKTTLINLLKKILKPEVFKFGEEDIPVMEVDNWYNKVFPCFEENMKSKDEPEQKVTKIIAKVFQEESKITIPECKVKFKIDYSEKDDLRNFMDYIMDLDESKNSFYFLFSLEINIGSFGKLLLENYNKLMSRFENNENNKNKNAIKNILIKIYAKSIEEKCYFTDVLYENETIMDLGQFRKLFNFENINAGRALDDFGNDNGHNLSKKLVSLAKLFKINAYDSIKRSEWIKKRKETKLRFSIPNSRVINKDTKEQESDSEFTLRDILEATSNAKTDFMYSVIMYGFDEKMLPTYIQEGLKWLMK